MTENREPSKLEQFIKESNVVESLGDTQKSMDKDPRDELQNKAYKNAQKAVYEILPEFIESVPDEALREQLRAIGRAEDLNSEFVHQGLQYISQKALMNASNILYNNVDDVVAELPNEGIDKVVLDKELVKTAGDKPGELFERYGRVKGLEELLKKAKTGSLTGEQKENLLQSAAKVMGDYVADSLKKEKRSQNLQDLARAIVTRAVLAGYIGPSEQFMKMAAERAYKDARKEFEEANSKYMENNRADLYGVARGAIAKLVKDKDPEKFSIGYQLAKEASKAKAA